MRCSVVNCTDGRYEGTVVISASEAEIHFCEDHADDVVGSLEPMIERDTAEVYYGE